MANITLTNLPTVTSLTGTEPLLGVQSSTSVQITTGQIASYAGALFGVQPINSGDLLANVSAVDALPTGVGVSEYLDFTIGSTQGDIMYRGSGVWQALTPGIAGQALTTNGAGADLQWRSTAGVGTVISVTAGTNLSATPANPITASGTINTVMNPAFTTSVTTPSIYGGSSVSQTLLLQSTTGVGTSDSILFKVGNNGAVTALTIGTTGASTFGVSATSPLFIATASRTATATTGAFSYGTNGFSDTNVLASFQSSVNSYTQATIQNTSNGTVSSAEFIAYNDAGTASTNYAAFGINSSGYTGTGSLNTAGYGFFTTGSTDLVLGTIGANAIHFVTNSSATDAMTISSAGVVSIPSASITSLTTPLVIGGTTASSSLTLQSTSGVGTTDTIVFKTGNNGAVTALTIASNGNATFLSTSTTAIGTLTLTNALGATYGGTGQSTVTTGDLLYGSGTNTWGKLADVATGSVLVSGGVGVAPSYSSSPTISTSITTPIHYGGTTASSSLTLQSTSGAGTTDSIIFKVGNAGATTALTIGTGTAGSLTFGGTAQRFLADFSNATVNSRFAFQASTTNASTGIYALPNGTSTAASWQATNAADPTNASKILMATNGTTDVQLVSGINGTGTYLPLAFYNNGVGQFVINTSGAWGIGPTATASYGTSGQAYISGGNAAQPTWGTLGATGGGTGQNTVTTGDLLYGSATNTWGKLADVAVGSVLVSGGVGVAPSYSASPTVTTLNATTVTATAGAGFQNMVVQTTGTSASYSLPAALQVTGAKFRVTVIGGGAGGGGTNVTAGQAGGGGGSGAVGVIYLTYVAGQNTLTYTVGAAVAAAAANANGNAGNSSSIVYNSLTYTAGGGTGGTANGAGGAGGTTSGTAFTLSITGQAGAAGGVMAATSNYIPNGGDTPLGYGSGGRMSATAAGGAGSVGAGYGSGGSGARNGTGTTSLAGGGGNAGVVIIEY